MLSWANRTQESECGDGPRDLHLGPRSQIMVGFSSQEKNNFQSLKEKWFQNNDFPIMEVKFYLYEYRAVNLRPRVKRPPCGQTSAVQESWRKLEDRWRKLHPTQAIKLYTFQYPEPWSSGGETICLYVNRCQRACWQRILLYSKTLFTRDFKCK